MSEQLIDSSQTMAPTLSTLHHKLGFAGKAGVWKLLALIFALLNLKSLPFAWHIRHLKGLAAHIRTSYFRIENNPGPSTLFQPLITSSRSGFLECDYNLHKSNSTYFIDFDVGRLELLVALLGHGMRETWRELALEEQESRGVGATAKGRFEIRLGGVSCLFRKEIKPYEKFEVWTRVLSWDQKWLYIICHFVKPGVVKPKRYTLQPWRKGRQQQEEEKDHETEGGSSRGNGSGGDGNPTAPTPSPSSAPHPAIFAAGIAKYVYKKGRLTIPPERVLRASKLLPPKPPADGLDPDPDPETPSLAAATPTTPTPPEESSSSPSNTAAAAAVSLVDQQITPGHNEDEDIVVESLEAAPAEDEDGDGEWTWERVEAERQRGLGIAGTWASLEELSGEFGGDGSAVLGLY